MCTLGAAMDIGQCRGKLRVSANIDDDAGSQSTRTTLVNAAGCAEFARLWIQPRVAHNERARLEHRNLVVGLVMEDEADPGVPDLVTQPANLDAMLTCTDGWILFRMLRC